MRFNDDREPEYDENMSIKGRENGRVGLWLRERKKALKLNEEEICSGLAPRFRAGVCAAPLRHRPERSQPHCLVHRALLLHRLRRLARRTEPRLA